MKKLIIALTVSTVVLASALADDSKAKAGHCDQAKTTASADAKGACCDKDKLASTDKAKGGSCDKDKMAAGGACCGEKSACSKTPSKTIAMSPKAAAMAAK